MLAYVAPLWIIGVICLVASVVGSSVKLGGSEIPAISSPSARLVVGVIGVVTLALGPVLLIHDLSRSDASSTGTGSDNWSPDRSSTPQITSDPPVSTTSTTSTSAATSQTTSTSSPPPANPPISNPPVPTAVRVQWEGTLTLGGYGGTGGGWFLDPVPPSPAVTGDLYFGNTNEVAGRAIVAWDGSGQPEQLQCADLLNTRLGQRWVDVRVGSIACFKTEGGRVGYFKVATIDSGQLNPSMTVAATIWER